MRKSYSLYLLLLFAFTSCAAAKNELIKDLPEGLYAIIDLEKGSIVLELFYKEVPMTVSSFVGLAMGKFAIKTDRKGNFFAGLTFHRVVKDFVAQGGDPNGNGTGGPGYSFNDEIVDSFKFSSEGILAMANSGTNSNGSQFFITLGKTPWLEGKHTIFGKVAKNMDVVKSIKEGDTMLSVKIIPKGNDPAQFIKNISWKTFSTLIEKKQKELKEKLKVKKNKIIAELEKASYKKTQEGIYYKVISKKKGKDTLAKKGDTIQTQYELRIYGNNEIIDSSYKRKEPLTIVLGSNQIIQGWEIILQKIPKGAKWSVVIPPELGYGNREVGNVIPAYSFLHFTIELESISK